MPESTDQNLATLRTIAEQGGFSLTDDELQAIAGPVNGNRGRLRALRADIVETEEPAAVFGTPAGASHS